MGIVVERVIGLDTMHETIKMLLIGIALIIITYVVLFIAIPDMAYHGCYNTDFGNKSNMCDMILKLCGYGK